MKINPNLVYIGYETGPYIGDFKPPAGNGTHNIVIVKEENMSNFKDFVNGNYPKENEVIITYPDVFDQICQLFKKNNLQEDKEYVQKHCNYFDKTSNTKSLVGQIEDMSIYLVNGNEVKVKYHMDFVEGGNDMTYGVNAPDPIHGLRFMPANEIWLDAHMDLDQLRFIAYHEYIERYLMVTYSMIYDKAHIYADRLEYEYRKNHLAGSEK